MLRVSDIVKFHVRKTTQRVAKIKVTAQITSEIRQIAMPVGCKAKNVSLHAFSTCLQALML